MRHPSLTWIIFGMASRPSQSFLSFTNLMYKVHVCGIIGCPEPDCDKPPHLPHQCHRDKRNMHGRQPVNGGATSGGGVGGMNGALSGGSSSSSSSGGAGKDSISGGGSDGSQTGSGDSSYSPGSGGSDSSTDASGSGGSGGSGGSSGYSGASDIVESCQASGGCTGLYSYYCTGNGDCYYRRCKDAYSGGCEYVCDKSWNCYQVCDEYVDGVGCASGFLETYGGKGSNGSKESKGGGLHAVGDKNTWTSPTIISLLLASLALAMGMVGVASKRNRNQKKKHALVGSLGRRMKLFARMAPKQRAASGDPTRYQRTNDDGTASIAAESV